MRAAQFPNKKARREAQQDIERTERAIVLSAISQRRKCKEVNMDTFRPPIENLHIHCRNSHMQWRGGSLQRCFFDKGGLCAHAAGDDAEDLGRIAWHSENPTGRTHPVRQKQPNAWGLHGVHGAAVAVEAIDVGRPLVE